MKQVAKWIVIGWTLLCLLGVGLMFLPSVLGMGDSELRQVMMEDDGAVAMGCLAGSGCFLLVAFIAWALVAIPALVVFMVSKE